MRRIVSVLAAVLAGWLIPSPAGAAVIAAVPGSFQATYATPVVVAPTAAPVTFVNTDIQPHDVVAKTNFASQADAKKAPWCSNFKTKKGKKTIYNCPVFWSEAVGTGESTSVEGIDGLTSGQQYSFYCSIHPRMTGTLVAG